MTRPGHWLRSVSKQRRFRRKTRSSARGKWRARLSARSPIARSSKPPRGAPAIRRRVRPGGPSAMPRARSPRVGAWIRSSTPRWLDRSASRYPGLRTPAASSLSARTHDELTVAARASFHVAPEVVNAARLDPAGIAARGCSRGMPYAVERLVPDNDGEVRHAARGETHFALTVGAFGHVIDCDPQI